MNPVVTNPYIRVWIDLHSKGGGSYVGQGTTGDIPHGLGCWKAHEESWFAGEWNLGVPVRGIYYDGGFVDFGEFSPELSRLGWAAALTKDIGVGSAAGTDPALQRAMAALGTNDPGIFPGSRRAHKAAAAPSTQPPGFIDFYGGWNRPPSPPDPFMAAMLGMNDPAVSPKAAVAAAVQPPGAKTQNPGYVHIAGAVTGIEGEWDGTSVGPRDGLIGQLPKRMPDDVAQKVLRRSPFAVARAHSPSGVEGCTWGRPRACQETSLPAQVSVHSRNNSFPGCLGCIGRWRRIHENIVRKCSSHFES